MPSQSRPAIGPVGKGIGNGGTSTGVPGTGASAPTMPGTPVSHRMPAIGSMAMPVAAPPISASTAGAIGNGGMIGPAGGNDGDGICASSTPFVYQVMPVTVLVVASAVTGTASGGGGRHGAPGEDGAGRGVPGREGGGGLVLGQRAGEGVERNDALGRGGGGEQRDGGEKGGAHAITSWMWCRWMWCGGAGGILGRAGRCPAHARRTLSSRPAAALPKI